MAGLRLVDCLTESLDGANSRFEHEWGDENRVANFQATISQSSSDDGATAFGGKNNDVALILKVHPSNYRVEGFVEETPVDQLATLGVPVVSDIGSGLLDAACPWLSDGPPAWLNGEPAAKQTLAAGADLVTFSGDKLLGGPQSGFIVGRSDLIKTCSEHPLARAMS